MIIDKVYICDSCNREYDSKDDASLCCSCGSSTGSVYVCDSCGKPCEIEEDAILCCADEIELSYKCKCDSIFDSHEEAVNCFLHHL